MDYTTLTLAEVKAGLDDVSRDVQSAFGGLDARQLNWRPDATRWSVAQCLEHLLVANRLPLWPGVIGRMLIRSQAPGTTRKFKAPAMAQPAASAVAADIVQQFVVQHADAVARLRTVDEHEAARAIMTSPFIRVVTYSVLDGWRLIVAHDHRHIEQARRVMQSPAFPAS